MANLITPAANAEDFTVGYWDSVSFVIVDSNAEIAPDGTTTADRINDLNTGGTGSASIQPVVQITVSNSTLHTQSLFVKADGVSWVAIATIQYTTPGNVWTYFDVGSGAVGTVGTGHTNAGIDDYGDGWYRCYYSFTTDSSDTNGRPRYALADGDGDMTVPRDGTSSLFMWGAVLEEGGLTDYTSVGGTTLSPGGGGLSFVRGLPRDMQRDSVSNLVK